MKTKGTVWVLGASSGLGLATAEAFAKDGWLVVAGARSFEGAGSQARGLAENHGSNGNHGNSERTGNQDIQENQFPNVHKLPLDVTDEESANRFVQAALAISSRVDVLCYAAGLLKLGSCEETGTPAYDRVLQTNFIGMTRMVAKVLPVMRGQRSGKLVLFSSLNGLVGTPFQSAYTASKHAIEGYAQCLSMEVRPFGIRVCVVQPGDHQGGEPALSAQYGRSRRGLRLRERIPKRVNDHSPG